MTVKKNPYVNINNYIRYLKNQFKRIDKPFVGRFFCYNYKFSEDYEYEKLKFFDWMPCTFCFEINPEKGYFVGLNFHHMPVRPRLLYLDKVRSLSERMREIITPIDWMGDRRYYKIPGLNYPKVYKILRKSKICIRRYRFDRVFDLRSVPLAKIYEVMHYYAKTYYGVTIKSIENRYAKFHP